MAWCGKATCYYLNQCWPYSLTYICGTRGSWVKRGPGTCVTNELLYLNHPHGNGNLHDDVIKWKHFPGNWPFVWGIHRSPVNSPHKGQWRGALMFSFICVWINDWVNNREAGDLRRYHAHCDVIVRPTNRSLCYDMVCFTAVVSTGHFMYVDTRRGTEGHRAWLRSPGVKVENGSCLNFNIYMTYSEKTSEDRFRWEKNYNTTHKKLCRALSP